MNSTEQAHEKRQRFVKRATLVVSALCSMHCQATEDGWLPTEPIPAAGGQWGSALTNGAGASGGSRLGANSGGMAGSSYVTAAAGARTVTRGGASSVGAGGARTGGAGQANASTAVALGFSCLGVADGSLAAWLSDHDIACAGTWNDVSADAQEQQWTLQSDAGGEYRAWNKLLDDAIGGIFGDETWEQAAAGQFDERWQHSVDALRSGWGSRDPSLLQIRFAHEFNLDGSDWRVTRDDAPAFKQAWQRFYRIFKQQLPKANLVWCPNDGTSGSLQLNVLDAYPGDAYVDVIAIDTYNQYPWVNDRAAFERKLASTNADGSPLGAESWRRFAELHQKPFAIGEWASNGDPNGADGCGDSPEYIQDFHDWLVAHGGTGPGKIKYAVYFNYMKQFQIFPDTMQPNAQRLVKSLF